jgi:peptide/nickel transport system permease protein
MDKTKRNSRKTAHAKRLPERDGLRRFFRNKRMVFGMVVLAALILIAVFAPWIAGQSPYAMTKDYGAAPTSAHILGTDMMGRDTFARLIYAARVSLIVGFGTTAISVAIGLVLGLLAGYVGGIVDIVIMRLLDVLMTFPPMILVLVFVGIVKPGITTIVVTLGMIGWTHLARLVRGEVLSIKERNYVKAAVMAGYSRRHILFSQILPNVMAPVMVNATFKVAGTIVTEASLSFLGLGVQPPAPSWGNMLSEAKSLTVLTSKLWLWVPASLLLLLTVVAFNFVGEGLRSTLFPTNRNE